MVVDIEVVYSVDVPELDECSEERYAEVMEDIQNNWDYYIANTYSAYCESVMEA